MKSNPLLMRQLVDTPPVFGLAESSEPPCVECGFMGGDRADDRSRGLADLTICLGTRFIEQHGPLVDGEPDPDARAGGRAHPGGHRRGPYVSLARYLATPRRGHLRRTLPFTASPARWQ